MDIQVFPTTEEMGQAAAERAAGLLKSGIERHGWATFVMSTGASQFEFLDALTHTPGIDWARTTMYHLDEFIGLPETHPASFRRYLRERFLSVVSPGRVVLVEGDAVDPEAERCRLNDLISSEDRIDVAFIGIGENGHIAFNDPPADFTTTDPYLIVEMDEACRLQQVGEGWFSSLDEVPRSAVSMSVHQIMCSEAIVSVVPDRRKAQAVHDCLTGDISPLHPASILRQHANSQVFLDKESASLLDA